MKKFMRSVVFGAMAVMAPMVMVTPALAGFIGGGYTYNAPGYEHYTLDLSVEGVGDIDPTGDLYWSQTGTDAVSGALVLPLELVDNTYGDNSVGWGKNVAPSGKNHNLSDLTHSDKAEISIVDNEGNSVFDFTSLYYPENGVLYKDEVGAGAVDSIITSLMYNFDEYGDEKDGPFSEGDKKSKGGKKSKSEPNSPETNYGSGAPDYDFPGTAYGLPMGSSFGDWAFQVIYEFEVSGLDFSKNAFGSVKIGTIHVSKNKLGKNKVFVEEYSGGGGGAQVPEPITMVLIGTGLGFFGLTEFKKRFMGKGRKA
jgi:hypothetical protein